MGKNFDDYHIETFLNDTYSFNLVIKFNIKDFINYPNFKKEITEELQINEYSCSDLFNIQNNLKLDNNMPLGSMLLEFLNNSDELCNLLEDYKKNIDFAPFIINSHNKYWEKEISNNKFSKYWKNNKQETIEKYDNRFNYLYTFLLDLNDRLKFNKFLPIILNEFYNFYYIDFSNLVMKLENNNLKKSIEGDRQSTIESKIDFSKYDKSKYIKLDGRKDSDYRELYKSKVIQFLDDLISEIKNLKSFCEDAFKKVEIETEDDYKKIIEFNKNTLILPNSTIKFNKEKKSTVFEYTYNVHNLSELANITLNHLLFNRQILIRCKYCNSFFIPKTNSENYCDRVWGKRKNGEDLTCKQKGKDKSNKAKKPQIKQEYNAIYTKISNTLLKRQWINKPDKKQAKNELECILENLRNNYNDDKVKTEEEIIKILDTAKKEYAKFLNKYRKNKNSSKSSNKKSHIY